MMKLVFTLCSNNYLSHAKAMCDSIAAIDSDLKIVIGLVDKFDTAVDYSYFQPYEILPFDEIGFDCFHDMLGQYNVIEFNTAVKPYYFQYFFNKYGADTSVLYIDPDILFYQSTDSLFELLSKESVLLTPNLTRVTNTLASGELASLRHGMFNLGFAGVRNTAEGVKFIEWWMSRLRTHCKIDKCRGVFVDQKWVDLAPLYFPVHISYNVGYNMAWWNLNERQLVVSDDTAYVNTKDQPLVFFHFSGYKPGSTFLTGRHNDNSDYEMNRHPALQSLFADYEKRLAACRYEFFWALKPRLKFGFAKVKPKESFPRLVKKGFKKLFN